MYTCRDSVNLLMDLLDGECSAEVERELRRHLAGCNPCEEFLDSYRKLPSLCRKALVEKMPEEIAEKMTEFLRTKMAGRKEG